MEPVLQTVATDLIDGTDATFAIHRYAAALELFDSLDRVGILEPLWLLPRAQRLVVVDGHQRLAWARRAGLSRLRCLVHDADTPIDQLWRGRLEGKLFGPELNVAEKAQVLARFSAVTESSELARRVLPRLGIRTGAGSLDRWRRIAEAGDAFLSRLADGTVAERAALELVDWPSEACIEAFEILGMLRPSASIQVEILDAVKEIALASGTDLLTVLRQDELRRILTHEDQNHRQKTGALRDLLTRLRFPRLSARIARVREVIADADLPDRLRVRPPRFFEGGVWSLEISFSSRPQLEEELAAARKFAASGKLDLAMTMPEPEPAPRAAE